MGVEFLEFAQFSPFWGEQAVWSGKARLSLPEKHAVSCQQYEAMLVAGSCYRVGRSHQCG